MSKKGSKVRKTDHEGKEVKFVQEGKKDISESDVQPKILPLPSPSTSTAATDLKIPQHEEINISRKLPYQRSQPRIGAPPVNVAGRRRESVAGGSRKGVTGGSRTSVAGGNRKGLASGSRKGVASGSSAGLAGESRECVACRSCEDAFKAVGSREGVAGGSCKGVAGGSRKSVAGGSRTGVTGGSSEGVAGGSSESTSCVEIVPILINFAHPLYENTTASYHALNNEMAVFSPKYRAICPEMQKYIRHTQRSYCSQTEFSQIDRNYLKNLHNKLQTSCLTSVYLIRQAEIEMETCVEVAKNINRLNPDENTTFKRTHLTADAREYLNTLQASLPCVKHYLNQCEMRYRMYEEIREKLHLRFPRISN